MTAKHSLEQRLADFYAAEAPVRAPDWVLANALVTVDTTPQRRAPLRVPWRLPPMFTGTRVAAVTAAAVALIALGLVLGPGGSGPAEPTPSPTAAPSASAALPSGSRPPALSQVHESGMHGISVSHPAGWTVVDATEPWTAGLIQQDSPYADVIYEKEDDSPFIAVASQPLGGSSGEDWATAYLANFAEECGPSEAVTVYNFPGILGTECGMVLAWAGERGFLIWLYRIDDPDWFRTILRTVQLNPGTAWTRPALSETFTSDIHGISVGYPNGWNLQPATEPWPPGEEVQQGSAFADVMYEKETDSPFIALSSQPLGATTVEAFAAEYLAGLGEDGCLATEPVTVDGGTGVRSTACAFAFVGAGERVYLVWVYRISDRAWIDDVLASVRIDPASAVDP